MRVLVQRCSAASVEVDGEVIGSVQTGLLALVGIFRGDTPELVSELARKTARLRIFADAEGKTNLDVRTVGGAVLVVSQFTLCATMRKGNRPSFNLAAPPQQAAELVELYEHELRAQGVETASGRFGATMSVQLTNQGPFTVLLEKSVEGAGS